ncbi:uncharacterized protein LOC126762066 [Bactrocera neohumeralis]|uniref:uncharacterized protein LOC126762066 n=1 Tax=Bactrocera neohumeralis TaxID=98809 RepID=UPI002165F73A|nr:uncharacterized protein LOC126762066 [Bactrocera neohumeralis]
MKIFALLFLLACVYWTTTSADVHKSEQKNRFGLVNQRIRSLRDGLGVGFASNTKTPKPVAPLADKDDVDDPWDLGAFFGQLSTKVGSVVKTAVGDLLECVDNVFKCLSPGGNKKGKKDPKDNKGGEGASGANSNPKPTETVSVKPTESTTSGSTTVTSTASTTSGNTTVTSTTSTTSGSTTVSSTQSTTTIASGK